MNEWTVLTHRPNDIAHESVRFLVSLRELPHAQPNTLGLFTRNPASFVPYPVAKSFPRHTEKKHNNVRMYLLFVRVCLHAEIHETRHPTIGFTSPPTTRMHLILRIDVTRMRIRMEWNNNTQENIGAKTCLCQPFETERDNPLVDFGERRETPTTNVFIHPQHCHIRNTQTLEDNTKRRVCICDWAVQLYSAIR